MRVLFYIHSLSAGGAERVTATLANYWVGKGWSVTVVTVAGRERDFYMLDQKVKRIALSLNTNSTNSWQAVLNNTRRIRVLRRLLRETKPDVGVAMMATANVTLALAGIGLPTKKIGSERTYPPAMPLGRAWETIRRWVYPLMDGLVAQTQQSAAWLSRNAPAAQIKVFPNPLLYPLSDQEPRLPPTKVLHDISCMRLLLAVGRLGEEKRFDRLLNAFASIYESNPDWLLVILGEGPERNSLEAQAKALGIDQRVFLPGAVGNVGEWYKAADLYVLTSRFEGFPNTLVEALAHGLPAVAVDCETGPREILRHEVDGLLVPQDDQHALVEALGWLMGDGELRERFGEKAIEARERFAVSRVAAQWEQMFDSLRQGS